MMNELIPVDRARALVETLFLKAGMGAEKVKPVTAILLEGELLGHQTHGLHLVMPYMEHLKKGSMQAKGAIEIINHTSTSELWNGQYLPGPWLVKSAIDRAKQMAHVGGTGTIVIQQCSHIGCLAAYMEEATRDGSMIILACSDPDNKTVAPFGGTTGVYSPNPLALGIPTESEPIIIDVSMSATSNGLIHQKKANGERLEHPWLMTAEGYATDDPATFFDTPPATILPLGGLDSGYKGFALGIMIEALTSALGGHGRVKEPGRWGASTFLQVINPNTFAGESYFKKEMEHLKNNCLKSRAADTSNPVRMPGQRGLERKQKQLQDGLDLRKDTLEGLQKLASDYGLSLIN